MIICREVVSSKYNKQRFESLRVPWVRILPGTGGWYPFGTGGKNPFGTGGWNPFGYPGLESFQVPRVRIPPRVEPLGRLKRADGHIPDLFGRCISSNKHSLCHSDKVKSDRLIGMMWKFHRTY